MIVKVVYGGFVALAMLILLWAAPRGIGVLPTSADPVKKQGPSVRGGGTYVFVGGFGGK